MITKIHYKNFKALRDTTLPLGRFTLIVGANGTGKSTALRALEITKKTAEVHWSEIVSSELNNNNKIVALDIQINGISVNVAWKKNETGNLLFEELKTSEFSRDQKMAGYSQEAFNEWIKAFGLFSFESDKIAEPVSIRPEMILGKDGSNLAGILWQIQNSEPEIFEELNSELNRWFSEFDRIVFEIPKDGQVSFLLRTEIGKHKIKAKDLSDGTRLALAYLTLAYLPHPPKLVAFEEPEHGVHPRLLENIQEAMYRLAYPENYGEKREPVQVIATTHSPYLLDLYKEHPEEIVIASKDEKGVHFERLIDKPHYEEVIQDAPLGDIWYSGVLGGVPVQP